MSARMRQRVEVFAPRGSHTSIAAWASVLRASEFSGAHPREQASNLACREPCRGEIALKADGGPPASRSFPGSTSRKGRA